MKFIIIATLIASAQFAHAWGDLGHKLVGAIADKRIEPKTREFIESIIGVEPLAVTATFADDVRDDERFNHRSSATNTVVDREQDKNNLSDYHFVEIPTGYSYKTKPVLDLKDAFGAINGAVQILTDSSNRFPRSAKIIALRYLIHIVGDIHQPLHVGNNADLGANLCYVKQKNSKYPSSLHSVWDSDLVDEMGARLVPTDIQATTKPPRYYPQFMALLNQYRSDKLNAAKPTGITKDTIESWMNDSVNIRESSVYPDAGTTAAGGDDKDRYKRRPYCMWMQDRRQNLLGDTSVKKKDDIPLNAMPELGDAYLDTNVPIVEDQIIKAGIRVAAILDQIAAASTAKGGLTLDQSANSHDVFDVIHSIFRNLSKSL